MFKTIKEKRNYYSERKFGKRPTENQQPQFEKDYLTGEEITMLQRIAESTVNDYASTRSESMITEIPYLTNDVTDVNVFQEYKKPYPLKSQYQVREIIVGIMAGVKMMTVSDFRKENDPSKILLILHYPIVEKSDNVRYNLKWDSYIVNKRNYDEYHVTDPILYSLIKRYSRHVLTLSNSTDLFLPGMDIPNEVDYVQLDILEDAFKTLTKTVFVTTLLGRNLNVIDVMDYPAFNFALGTYKGESNMSDKFYRVVLQSTLLHVIPLWQNVITISYTVEIPSTKVTFGYDPNTMFSDFPELMTEYFPKMSPRSDSITTLSSRVTLLPEKQDLTRRQVYCANLNVRNKLASSLDRVKRYNQIKDKMYPKTRQGASTKLDSLLQHININNVTSVLDLGSAPGTWMQLLIEKYNIPNVHGITRGTPGDLRMYPNIIELINKTKGVHIHYDDIVSCDLSQSLTFNLITSDVATAHTNYITQSVEHDTLFLSVLNYIKYLKIGGTLIMKMYDMTDKMFEKVKSLAKYFRTITAHKPDGSCPTNPEMYLVFSGKDEGCANFELFEKDVQAILYNQIHHVHKLITRGFGIKVSYKVAHFNTRLSVESIRDMPHHLHPCLVSLKFSDALFPDYLEGTLTHDVSHLGDKFLRFSWIVPSIPFPNTKYITETSLGYESNNIGLQNLMVFHTGFVMQDGKRINFILVDKSMSCLFWKKYHDLYITTSHVNSLSSYQMEFKTAMKQPNFRFLFPKIECFYQLQASIRYISIASYLDWSKKTSPSGITTVLKQFFREAETMHLSHTKTNTGTTISRRIANSIHKTINLENQNDRLLFWEMYKDCERTSKTVRQIFSLMLEKYSVKIPDYELLQSSMCYVSKVYQEYTTRQICISQPACVQFRRQTNLPRL